MENKIKYLILFLAVFSAVVLYYTGFKNLKLKKKNFFYTSLLIALTFLGCNFSETNAKDQKSDEEQNNNTYGKDDPEYIKELNNNNEWKEFKAFWQNLDRIEAATNATPESFGSYIDNSNDYDRTYMRHDSLTKYVKAMEPLLKKLAEKKILDTLESRLLLKLCNERIDYIFYGRKSMMMRMVVHPGITEQENTLANLEFRIDTLLNLKDKGLIDTDEMNKAITNINREINKFGVLDIFGKYNIFYFLPYEAIALTESDTLSVAAMSTYGFEKAYSEFMGSYNHSKADEQKKALYSKYIVTKKELESFEKDRERFCAIIKDLIVND